MSFSSPTHPSVTASKMIFQSPPNETASCVTRTPTALALISFALRFEAERYNSFPAPTPTPSGLPLSALWLRPLTPGCHPHSDLERALRQQQIHGAPLTKGLGSGSQPGGARPHLRNEDQSQRGGDRAVGVEEEEEQSPVRVQGGNQHKSEGGRGGERTLPVGGREWPVPSHLTHWPTSQPEP